MPRVRSKSPNPRGRSSLVAPHSVERTARAAKREGFRNGVEASEKAAAERAAAERAADGAKAKEDEGVAKKRPTNNIMKSLLAVAALTAVAGKVGKSLAPDPAPVSSFTPTTPLTDLTATPTFTPTATLTPTATPKPLTYDEETIRIHNAAMAANKTGNATAYKELAKEYGKRVMEARKKSGSSITVPKHTKLHRGR